MKLTSKVREYFDSDEFWGLCNNLPGRIHGKVLYDWKLNTRMHVIKIALTPDIPDLTLEVIHNIDFYDYVVKRTHYESRVEALEEAYRSASHFYADNPEGMLEIIKALSDGSRTVYKMIGEKYREKYGLKAREGEDDL